MNKPKQDEKNNNLCTKAEATTEKTDGKTTVKVAVEKTDGKLDDFSNQIKPKFNITIISILSLVFGNAVTFYYLKHINHLFLFPDIASSFSLYTLIFVPFIILSLILGLIFFIKIIISNKEKNKNKNNNLYLFTTFILYIKLLLYQQRYIV